MLTYIEKLCYKDKPIVNQIDDLTFALLLAISADVKDINDFYHIIEEENDVIDVFSGKDKVEPFAFVEFVTGSNRTVTKRQKLAADIINDIDKKGYYVDVWDEGCFGIALPGRETDVMAAIARMESGTSATTFDRW